LFHSYETESCEDEASEKSGDERNEKGNNASEMGLHIVTPIMIDITPPSPPPILDTIENQRGIPQVIFLLRTHRVICCNIFLQLFVSFDDEDGNEMVEELSQQTEHPSSPSDSQTSSPTSDSPIPGKAKRRPPPLYIINSNFTSHGDPNSSPGRKNSESPKSSSPTSRKCLVKQSVVCEDTMAASGPNDSPKFLIPPGKFDSTPR